MSRPLAYKMTDLDAKVNSQEISTGFGLGRRRMKLPGIVEMSSLDYLLFYPR